MKNKIKLILLFIILPFLFFSCGFKPMLKEQNLQNLNIKKITYKGLNNLTILLKNSINLKENKNLERGYNIILKVTEDINSITKNTSGITTEESIKINIELMIKDHKENIILEDNFYEKRNVTVTNNPSSDNEIKNIERRNIISALTRKLLFSIQSEIQLKK